MVILAMFAIGARWSEDPPAPLAARSLPVANAGPAGVAWLIVVLTIGLLAASGPLAFAALNQAGPSSPPQLGRLTPPTGWAETPRFAEWTPVYANPSAVLQETFGDGQRQVGLFIAYYRNQNFERKLVTSTNVLATSNDPVWSVVSRDRRSIQLGDRPQTVGTANLLGKKSGLETRLAVWQWYWVNGRLTSSDFEAKLFTALSRLRGMGDDSAVIILYAPTSGEDGLSAFATAAAPAIATLLANAREAR